VCHQRYLLGGPGSRLSGPAIGGTGVWIVSSRALGIRRPLTVADLPQLSDAALLKLISGLSARDQSRPGVADLLAAAVAQKDARDRANPGRGPRIDVDPALAKLSPVDDVPLIPPGSFVDWLTGYLYSLTDDADDSTLTIPAKVYELVLEKIIGLPAVPVEVVIKLLGGADPANSGGDVIGPPGSEPPAVPTNPEPLPLPAVPILPK